MVQDFILAICDIPEHVKYYVEPNRHMPRKSSSSIRSKNTRGRGKRQTSRRPSKVGTKRFNRSNGPTTRSTVKQGRRRSGSKTSSGTSSNRNSNSSSALSSRTRKAIDTLPSHAQKIYRKAHKNALKQYSSPSKRRGGKQQSKEQVAHRVAWSAVKKEYKKKGDKWVSKEEV
jgi:cation transport regulator